MSYPFIDARLPNCPSFGFTFQPHFENEHIRSSTGAETPFRHWTYPLHTCPATLIGPRIDDEIDELLAFWYATGGGYYGFRVKNYGEFKSCRPSQTPAGTDQPTLSLGDDEYQLIKRYTAGSVDQDRIIKKPVDGSVIVFDGGSAASDFTVNHATGVITFSVAPAGAVTAGYEFDLPMRFEGDFPIQIVNKRAHSVAFILEEIRNPA